MADLLDCESYFFLLEDADEFNRNYAILDEDTVAVSSVSPLSDIEDIKDMRFSRRTFDEKTVKNKDGCDDLGRGVG